jgi:hypothetical protein
MFHTQDHQSALQRTPGSSAGTRIENPAQVPHSHTDAELCRTISNTMHVATGLIQPFRVLPKCMSSHNQQVVAFHRKPSMPDGGSSVDVAVLRLQVGPVPLPALFPFLPCPSPALCVTVRRLSHCELTAVDCPRPSNRPESGRTWPFVSRSDRIVVSSDRTVSGVISSGSLYWLYFFLTVPSICASGR